MGARSPEDRGAAITETAEREISEDEGEAFKEADASLPSGGVPTSIASFMIALAPTYYERGIVNPGLAASAYLGRDGEPVVLLFSDGTPAIASRINRTANTSGAVRIVGGNRQIAAWFQRHFQLGESFRCEILDAHTIRFCSSER